MPNIHNINSKDIIKFLLKEWFKKHHQTKILNIKTILSIFKQSWINKDNYLKL